jgi:hypothetical protein
MTHRLDLTDHELDLVLSALAVTAPVGGGSAIFTLYRKLCDQVGNTSSETTEALMCSNVLDAAIECGVVARVN